MEGHKYFKGVPLSIAELQILMLHTCDGVHIWLSVHLLFLCVSLVFMLSSSFPFIGYKQQSCVSF